jgi:glycosyltransferase 2 family protein
LVAVFVQRAGAGAISLQLSRLGPAALSLLFPYMLGTCIGALPWARLLPSSARPPLAAVILSRFAASGANALLPLFGVAGEPSRLLWLRADARARGVAAIVLDRVLYNSASALLLLVAAVVSLDTRLPRALQATFGGIALLILLVTCGAVWLVARLGVGARLSRLLRKLLGSTYGEPHFGKQVDDALQSSLSSRRRSLVSGLMLHFIGRLVLASETYVALRCLHAPAGPAEALVLATAPIASGFFASSIPSQLGVQEGVLMLICHALGLDSTLGVTLSLLIRLRQLVFVPLTPLLLVLARSSQRPRVTYGTNP